MDRALWKWTYIKEIGRTSREVGRTRKCIVLRKWIVTDGKELGQQSESQARLPSAIIVFSCGFSSASRVSFKSEVLSE